MALTDADLSELLLECQFLPRAELPPSKFQHASRLAARPRDIFHCDRRPASVVPAESGGGAWRPYVDFFVRPFVVLPFQQKKIELVVVPHAEGLLRLSKLMFQLNEVFHSFGFDRGRHSFRVWPEAACLDCRLEMESKSFVFGEYKELKVHLANPTGQRIANVWLLNDKPLDFGHVAKELGPLAPGEERSVELAMRATVNERKGTANFLLVFETNGVLRSSLKRVDFTVANSFKTKCLLEQLDRDSFLVLIDLFDRKEPFVAEALFEVQKIILLSNVFDVDLQTTGPFRDFARRTSCSSLVYFILRRRAAFKEVLRKDKQVFFSERNVYSAPLAGMARLRESAAPDSDSRAAPAAEAPLKKELLLGFLEQENRAVRNEIRQKSRPDLFRDYRCAEFIDFCLLWTQRVKVPESSLFGGRRASAKFKRVNGQHSIINTAMNSVAFRIKHSIEARLLKKFRKPLARRRLCEFDAGFQNPIYRVALRHPRVVEHDFARDMTCAVPVEIRVTCLFRGADSFSTVHLDKAAPGGARGPAERSEEGLSQAEAPGSSAPGCKASEWLARLRRSADRGKFYRPRYLQALGLGGGHGEAERGQVRRPQLVLKLSNIHQVDDSDSGARAAKSGKRKETGSSKSFPVMVWQGNRNLAIESLEENDDFVVRKQVALFSKGLYNLNQLKLKRADGKVVNLSLHEKCLVRVK